MTGFEYYEGGVAVSRRAIEPVYTSLLTMEAQRAIDLGVEIGFVQDTTSEDSPPVGPDNLPAEVLTYSSIRWGTLCAYGFEGMQYLTHKFGIDPDDVRFSVSRQQGLARQNFHSDNKIRPVYTFHLGPHGGYDVVKKSEDKKTEIGVKNIRTNSGDLVLSRVPARKHRGRNYGHRTRFTMSMYTA